MATVADHQDHVHAVSTSAVGNHKHAVSVEDVKVDLGAANDVLTYAPGNNPVRTDDAVWNGGETQILTGKPLEDGDANDSGVPNDPLVLSHNVTVQANYSQSHSEANHLPPYVVVRWIQRVD